MVTVSGPQEALKISGWNENRFCVMAKQIKTAV